jgi:hypothetical protein
MSQSKLNTQAQIVESYFFGGAYKRLFFIGVISLVLAFSSCRSSKSDPKKITVRPRIYLEGSAPIPIFDEYDFISIQLGTVDNIFSDNPNDRIFALWLAFDRRSSMALQKETIRNIGKRLQLSVGGQLIGIHPIERAVSNGILPFILSESITEESATFLYREMGQSLFHIRAELNQ